MELIFCEKEEANLVYIADLALEEDCAAHLKLNESYTIFEKLIEKILLPDNIPAAILKVIFF